APGGRAMSLRAVIVDDEELARQVLREMLAAVPGVEVVAECANGFEAVKAVAEMRADLLLLDIQMPKLDGFEVLELIQTGRGTRAAPGQAPLQPGRAGGLGPAPTERAPAATRAPA
ncbi:MAG: LytR/AlgR family response regulator transcription factor, partial [Streptosporangiaceae bacterium]